MRRTGNYPIHPGLASPPEFESDAGSDVKHTPIERRYFIPLSHKMLKEYLIKIRKVSVFNGDSDKKLFN